MFTKINVGGFNNIKLIQSKREAPNFKNFLTREELKEEQGTPFSKCVRKRQI